MSVQKSGPDAARSRLRTSVANIDRELSRLTKEGATSGGKSPLDGLTARWAELVSQLALGPEPEVRECPSCSGIGIREATLCGFCWTRLEPPTREAATSKE